jgi:phospholipid/cholesterol/gamma-HCH transport system permease protein
MTVRADPDSAAPGIRFEAGASPRLTLHGSWLLRNLQRLIPDAEQSARRLPRAPLLVDARGLTALDTAGALLLVRTLRASGQPFEAHRIDGMPAAESALLKLTVARLAEESPARARHAGLRELLFRVGVASAQFWNLSRELLGFVGLVLVTGARVLLRRRKLRLTSTVFHMEQVGLDAVPIVALLTFLVGAVVAFVGASALRDFGAEVYTVELVSISYLREFGVLLTAILLAGRSGSAFTAQIGSMKSREELDAIQALGLDPIELLVIPRLLALLTMLPLLAFIAMLMGIVGGGVVAVFQLDITPGMFISRVHEMTEIRHFWVGMSKAPVFAFLIATVGCLEGFKVEGSAESVGRHTTSSVVQSIFLVIVFDALFAMFFMEIDL